MFTKFDFKENLPEWLSACDLPCYVLWSFRVVLNVRLFFPAVGRQFIFMTIDCLTFTQIIIQMITTNYFLSYFSFYKRY